MKNYNGGYQIIDLQNNDLKTNSTITINGIYDKIEGNYNKPLLFSGIVINGVEKPDTFATVEVDNTNYIVKLYDRKLTINDNDEITSVRITNHLYLYSMDFNDSTLETGISFPNGSYVFFLTTEKIEGTGSDIQLSGICLAGSYEVDNKLCNIGTFSMDAGEIVCDADTQDEAKTICQDYTGTPQLIQEIL